MPSNVSLERYAVIRVADNTDDQLPASAIENAVANSVTQEDFQTYILSQLKRLIWGNSTGHWTDDFRGDGVPSLSEAQSVQGAVTCVDIAVGSDTPVVSEITIPANALILNCVTVIDDPYLTGVTITIGQTGSPALLQGPADNCPQATNTYTAAQRTSWGSSELPVLVTLTGNVLSGSGTVTIEYTLSED